MADFLSLGDWPFPVTRPFRSRRDALLFLTQAVVRPIGSFGGMAVCFWSFPWGVALFIAGAAAFLSRGHWLSAHLQRMSSGLILSMRRQGAIRAMDGARAWTDALKAAGLDVALGLYVRKIAWGVSIGAFLVAFVINVASQR